MEHDSSHRHSCQHLRSCRHRLLPVSGITKHTNRELLFSIGTSWFPIQWKQFTGDLNRIRGRSMSTGKNVPGFQGYENYLQHLHFQPRRCRLAFPLRNSGGDVRSIISRRMDSGTDYVQVVHIWKRGNKQIFGKWDYSNFVQVSQFASAVFIAILSFDRYLAVCRPIQSSPFRTTQAAFVFSVAAWIMVILEMTPLFLFVKLVKSNLGIKNVICTCIRKCFRGTSEGVMYHVRRQSDRFWVGEWDERDSAQRDRKKCARFQKVLL